MAKRRGNNEGSIYRRSDGYWVAALTEPATGRRRVFYGKTRAEAHGKLQKAQRAATDNLPIAPARLTLNQFLTRWLAESVKPSVRPRTYESYDQLVRLHLGPGLGRIRLGRLDAQTVQAFLNKKIDSGLSPRTVQYLHATLRVALGQAERWGLVPRNVARNVKAPTVRPPQIEPFDSDEARRFLVAVNGHRLEALFVTAIATGCRQGELFGLTWGDVDLEAGRLHVRHSLSWSRTGQRAWELSEPKTARSRRALDLPAVAQTALQEHRVRQWEEQLKAGPLWEDHGFVFCTPIGRPLDGPNVTHALHRLLASAGLRRQRFHDLRHAAASLLLAQGLSLREIMELLGHSQIALTANLYTHLQPAMRMEAASRMDAVLSGP